MCRLLMTAAVWMRAMLDVLHGIKPEEVSWFVGRPKEICHDLVLGIDRTLNPELSVKWLYEPAPRPRPRCWRAGCCGERHA